MHSGVLELTKLTYTRLEDNLVTKLTYTRLEDNLIPPVATRLILDV